MCSGYLSVLSSNKLVERNTFFQGENQKTSRNDTWNQWVKKMVEKFQLNFQRNQSGFSPEDVGKGVVNDQPLPGGDPFTQAAADVATKAAENEINEFMKDLRS